MKKSYIILAIIVVIAICIQYFWKDNSNENYENIYLEEGNISTNIVEEKDDIKIHIAGEVISPGIYVLEEGSRIDDAIRYAGGITENADLDKVNLAYEVSDGEKIYIPSIFDEEIEYTFNSEATSNTTKVNVNKATSEQLQTINGIGPALAEKIIAYRTKNGKFSSIEDIKNVSGIGDKKFESIKDYIVVK